MPGSEIFVSKSAEQTLGCLDDIPEKEARIMAERARAKVLAGHTSMHRARELEDIIEGLRD